MRVVGVAIAAAIIGALMLSVAMVCISIINNAQIG